MLPLEPVIYYGCQRCDGLFSAQEMYTEHVVICSGDKQKSDCQWFACPRDSFLQFCCRSDMGGYFHSSTSSTIEEGKKEGGSIARQLQKCLSSPLRKVRVIGILKKPSPQLFSSAKKGVLGTNVDINVRRVNTSGTVIDSEHIYQSHLHSEALLKPLEETSLTDKFDQNETCFPTSGDDSNDKRIVDPDDSHNDTVEDPNWEQCQKDDHIVFRCKLCGHESNSVGFMRRHIKVHNNGEALQCDKCDFTTIWRNHLRLHLSKHEQPNFLCEHCPQRFKNRSSLTRHNAKKHNGKSNFSCKYTEDCGFVAVSSSSLRDHIRKHTGELLFCDYDQCKFMTKFEKALSLHKAKHQGKTRFICEVCGYKTIESGSFKRHSLTHTGRKLFKCPDCSYKATSRYVVVKHIYGKHINHKRFACNQCDFKTAYYSGLSMHLMAHKGIKPYKCSLCSYRSNLSNKVKRHCSQKHTQAEAKTIKVENCLRFDVKDYLNPEVSKVDVKVIRLTGDGEEEEVEEEVGETETAPAVIDPDIAEDNGLLCESRIPALPSESGEDLEDMSIIDGGFNLCSDPTFPLDPVAQNYQSEDSNSVFVTRPSRLNSTDADVELNKDFDIQKTKVHYFDSPDSSLQVPPGQGLTSGELVNLGLRSDSLECLTQIKASEKMSEFGNTVSHSSSNLEFKTSEEVDSPPLDVRTQLPVVSTPSSLFQMIPLPLFTVPSLLTPNTNQTEGSHKPLKSLLSPNLLRSMSERNLQLRNQIASPSLSQIPITIGDPRIEAEQSGRTVVLTIPRVVTPSENNQPDKINM